MCPTPMKTPTSNYKRTRTPIPRMSPMPKRLRTAVTYTPGKTPTAHTTGFDPSTDNFDRFIPSRRHMNVQVCRRALQSGERMNQQAKLQPETPLEKEFQRQMFSSICNVPLNQLNDDVEPRGILNFGYSKGNKQSNLLSSFENPYAHDTLHSALLSHDQDQGFLVQKALTKKSKRKIDADPVRILDAPDILNDYYVNVLSWGEDNVVAVALGRSAYLWNATTFDIEHLTTTHERGDYITSVSWCTMPGCSKYIAVGTNRGKVHLFDAQSLRMIRTLVGHRGYVGSLAWSHQWLSTGSSDSTILQHDIRSNAHIVSSYEGHEDEVCGLKWNSDGTTLASGGNDNFLCLWDANMTARSSSYNHFRRSRYHFVSPRLVLSEHTAAVKALDWCPFQRGLLATGGGTADPTIKFWNTYNGTVVNSIDTGAQVSSVLWSKHQRQLCTSHGCNENKLILWKYPTMEKMHEFTGHSGRILNTDMSPDGRYIISSSADETLRVWNMFETPSHRPSPLRFLKQELSFGTPTIR